MSTDKDKEIARLSSVCRGLERLRDNLLDRLGIVHAGQVSKFDWRPIETAPKDGTAIIVWSEEAGGPQSAWWAESHLVWATFVSEGLAIHTVPTHWMPLPEPPKINSEGEG